MTSRDSDYITNVRASAAAVFNGINTLLAAQEQWNALDYASTLPDGVGANAGVTKTQVGSVIFDTANALKTVLDAGNATNLANLL